MGLICSCDTVLPNLLDVTCPEDMDQVVKIAFQLLQTAPAFTATPAEDAIGVASSWIDLLASATSTKITLSPAVANVIIPSSEMVASGQDSNESVNGIGYNLGETNITVTGEIHSAPQAVVDALDELSCYSDASLGQSKLTAYFFLRRIKGISRVMAKGSAVAGDYVGFEIFNFRVSSPDSQGYNTKTKYMWSFTMQSDEWRSRELVAMAFNPLGLANAV
jgi:hypothetical protein